MNVLLLLHSLQTGGAEVLVANLARRLRAEGIGVTIGCLDVVGGLGAELEREGIAVELYGRRPGLDLGLPRRIARSVRNRSIDVVHAHQYGCFFYAVLAKLFTRKPLIFTEHGRFYPDPPSRRRRVFNRLFSRACDRVTAVSQGVRESLRAVEGFEADAIEVIYNGIEPERFATLSREEARRRLGLPPGCKVVGTVGRLEPIKHQGLLIRAFAMVAPEVQDARLLIVGEGSERERLRTLAADLGLADRVGFLGERSDVEQILPALDVFALTSLSEGTPMTILEAMAASTAIVSTAVGGIPEVVRDGQEGLLISMRPPDGGEAPGQAEESQAVRFAAGLRRALLDEELAGRLGAGACQRLRREFTIDAVSRRYVDLYGQVMGLRSPAPSIEGEQ